MITGHAPSGYVLSRLAGWRGSVMVAAIVGATWPDLDLIFFYLVNDRAFHHHRYWVHAPAFAVAVSLLLWSLARWLAPNLERMVFAFGIGWFLHILLDTPVGEIMWLWPFSDTLYSFYTVPATQSHWIASFVLHWSFLFELAIWLIALILFLKRPSDVT